MNSAFILKRTIIQGVALALCAILVSVFSFGILEPTLGHAQATDDFLITQTITSEISFVASTSDVVMTPALQSLTGGTSLGTTTVVIRTNDSQGYTLTIHFSSTTAMSRNGGGGVIEDYVATTTPDFTYSAQTFGQLAYRVTGSIPADVDPTFRDNGATCGVGALNTLGACWMGPETSANQEMIINSASSTPAGGSTTTLNFRVTIPANPTPTIPDGTYVATSTLTALTN